MQDREEDALITMETTPDADATAGERIPTSQVMAELGYRSARSVYRLADPNDSRWNGEPPLSEGVRRRGGKELWFLKAEVERFKNDYVPRRSTPK